MSLDPLSIGLSQIGHVVAGLDRSADPPHSHSHSHPHSQRHQDSAQRTDPAAILDRLVRLHGPPAETHALKRLASAALSPSSPSPGAAALLASRPDLCRHPARAASVRSAFERTPGPAAASRALRLPPLREAALCLALERADDKETAGGASRLLKRRLLELVQSYLDGDAAGRPDGGLGDCTPELLQAILAGVDEDGLGLAPGARDRFLERLRADFPRDVVPVVLAPLLYPDESETPLSDMASSEPAPGGALDGSLPELVRETGAAFTNSLEECRAALADAGRREISPAEVARTISAMVNRSPGSGAQWMDRWNPEIFARALRETQPALSFKEVVRQLDHRDFRVYDREGLALLLAFLRSGLQASPECANSFPVEHLYRHWTNVDGQISLISTMLKNPDVFCFADHAHHAVAVDALKTQPDGDGKEIANWRSLNLVELLLHFAERGFANRVQELFVFPVQHCPDVLLLALLQVNAKDSPFRHDLIGNLVPIFLGNHPNSPIVLHGAWHNQNPNVKSVVMQAMAAWYLRGENDQTRLSRILDVAQDLKCLSMLLNVQSLMFVLDLACLASRREYLKLDKWLTDKIRDHGESFLSTMVKFLQRRCPPVIGGKVMDDQIPKAAHLPPDTIATMVNMLQFWGNGVSPELGEAIINVTTNCTLVLNKRQTVPANLQRSHRILDSGPFGVSGINAQMFATPPVDPIALNTNFANMTINAPGGAFALPNVAPLISTPGSPSRLMTAGGPSNSPFAMMPVSHGNLQNLGPMTRLNQPMDKRIAENQGMIPEITQQVSKEIEDEANGYFQRIYNHPPHATITIDEVLDMLKKFSESAIKREREIYSCMLRNLFEEYRFFPQYPDKELQITAQLFGGIIERGLVTSYTALGLALKFVLEALKKQPGTKMYYFGIAALDRFKSRLKDYHKYCEHVKALEHFYEFPAHLIEYVEYGLQSQEPPNKPQGQIFPTNVQNLISPGPQAGNSSALYKSSTTPISSSLSFNKMPTAHPTSRPSIANATNIDTLLVATDKDEKIVSPPEIVQEKCAFIFNNLSQLNLGTKCEELRELMSEEYWPWLSQYLVMKRASIELNFHTLYSNFLDVLKIKEFNEMVTRETFRNIKVLLRSDKGIENFSDRSLLKNLGHWLGMLTLGRSRPILQIDIDLKSLIYEAYHRGLQELLYVVPFIAKVLESCDKSKVFKPPNPWTMAILNVLAELHQEPDLKLNLKFEIEVLCKNLNIEVEDLKPAIYLKEPERFKNMEYQLAHPGKHNATPIPISQNVTTPTPASLMSVSNIIQPEVIAGPPLTPTNVLLPNEGGITPLAKYSYIDVNLSSTNHVSQLMSINPQIFALYSSPHVKNLIKQAIERSIQEWLHPVVDRSIKYALTTCEQIVKKDFALDWDEVRMRTCAHNLMRNLTAGMAMITCREQLLNTISTNVKTALLSFPTTTQQKDAIETLAALVATENMELACAIIQKTAVEKALPELDKRLMSEYDARKIARQENRRYFDPTVLNYQNERMPEKLRMKVGTASDVQLIVYEEFGRNIPGFMPLKDQETSLVMPKPVAQDNLQQLVSFGHTINQQPLNYYSPDDLGQLISDTEQLIQTLLTIPSMNLLASNSHSLLECLLVMRRSSEMNVALPLIQKAVEGLAIAQSPDHIELFTRYKNVHIRALKLLQDDRICGQVWTGKQVVRYLRDSRDECKYNIHIIDCLIRNNLIHIPSFDALLAQSIENGNNFLAVDCLVQLLHLIMSEDRDSIPISDSDLPNSVECLRRLASHSRHPSHEGLTAVLESLQTGQDNNVLADRPPIPSSNYVHLHSGLTQARYRDEDTSGLVAKIEYLLREWVQIFHNPSPSNDIMKTFNVFVQQMNAHGILKTDEQVTKFFRICTQLVIDDVYNILEEEKLNPPETVVRNKYYHMIDAYVRLVSLLIKNSGEAGNISAKVNLLNKVLGLTSARLLQDHEEQGAGFRSVPYVRIFIMLFLDLTTPEGVLESITPQILSAFCHALHLVRPSLSPGFCFAWIDFISHRAFLSRVLASTPQQKGWLMYSELLVQLFEFMAPFLKNTELSKPIAMAYKGILKLLLVLLHDFPEFLCDYHYAFCDEIPPNCIQLRNLILSAFPRNMRLPDPFTPNLKVDMLLEIGLMPRVLTSFSIFPASFKKDLDSYMVARAPVTFLSELRSAVQVSNEPGKKYNIKLMNAVVLYVGIKGIQQIRDKSLVPNTTTIAHSAHMDIFQNLAVDLDHEGRYIFLNSIANQLRYPNCHTHYFSCALLLLFAEANTEAIQEQITRMLLERLIVNRPHPWGLLITFIELIKNPTYKFWDHDFVHCAPEIEKLFESIARSCLVEKTSAKQELEVND